MAKGEQKAKAAIAPMRIEEIPLSSINTGPQLIRHDQDDDDVIELAGDIAAHGLLQPIGVAYVPNEGYQLLWGGRRLAAFHRLRRSTIPARICDPTDSEGIISTALRENILRRQLTLAEEIDAVRSLSDAGSSPSQISDLCAKSRAWVDRRLAFHSLPVEIRNHVLEGDLPLGHGEALALLTDTSARSYLLAWTLGQRPTLAALRHSIDAIAATPTFGQAVEEGASATQQTAASQTFFASCHCCNAATEIGKLIILRACAPCAQAMHHAADPKDTANAQQ